MQSNAREGFDIQRRNSVKIQNRSYMENENEMLGTEQGAPETAPAPETGPAGAVDRQTAQQMQKGENAHEEVKTSETRAPRQSREENARFAAQRREQERKAEVERQVGRQMQSFYAGLRAAYESQNAQQAAQQLMQAGTDEETALWAAETMRQNRARAFAEAQVQKAEREQALHETAEGQLEQLNRRFPECGIRTLEDLKTQEALCEKAAQMPSGSLVDAYVLLHYDELFEAGAAAARQQAINAARSAEHLHGISTGGAAGRSELSEEEYEEYRKFGYSREQAARAKYKMYGR